MELGELSDSLGRIRALATKRNERSGESSGVFAPAAR
jgi:hypothetical protein